MELNNLNLAQIGDKIDKQQQKDIKITKLSLRGAP